MDREKKKKFLFAVHIVVIFTITFSFVATAVYAWFYDDFPHDLEILPAEFVAEIVADEEDELIINLTMPAATVYTMPGTAVPAGEADQFFNGCVRRTSVSISNKGGAPFKIRYVMDVLAAEAKDINNVTVARNSSAPYSVHHALIYKPAAELEAAQNLDAHGFPEYRGNIDSQLTAGSYESIDEMNEGVLRDVVVREPGYSGDPAANIKFVFAFWLDYAELQNEFGYMPNQRNINTVYTVKLTLIAISTKAPD